jgi:hypothetical protein
MTQNNACIHQPLVDSLDEGITGMGVRFSNVFGLANTLDRRVIEMNE